MMPLEVQCVTKVTMAPLKVSFELFLVMVKKFLLQSLGIILSVDIKSGIK